MANQVLQLFFTVVEDNASSLATDAAKNTGTGDIIKNRNIIFKDAHDIDQLKAINAATNGSISFYKDDVKLKGKAADITAALDGITGYKVLSNLMILMTLITKILMVLL